MDPGISAKAQKAAANFGKSMSEILNIALRIGLD
jgi:hypothetical protein